MCGQCQKSNRHCEEPTSKIKFTKTRAIKLDLRPMHAGRDPQTLYFPALTPCHDLSLIKSTTTKDGGMFQKLRVARPDKSRFKDDSDMDISVPSADACLALSPQPSLSSGQTLQYALLDTFNSGRPGTRSTLLGKYMRCVPQRIGQSAALDDAVACLITCHLYLNDALYTTEEEAAQLYARALRSLRMAIEDDEQGHSSNTLCAVNLLQYVELIGPMQYSQRHCNYIKHAGGATRLIKSRGPGRHQDDFSRMLLANQRGTAVSIASSRLGCMRRQPSRFRTPSSEAKIPF